MKKKEFFLHTLLYTVAPKLPSIVSFFILPFITPYLSLNDYGKFGLIIACYSLFLLSATLGQNVVLQNAYFEYKKNYRLVWRRSYGIMTAGCIIASLLLSAVLFFFLDKAFTKDYLITIVICSIALICSPIETIAQAYYILKEKPYAIALRAVLMSLLNVLILIFTIKFLKLGYIGLVAGFTAGSFFSILFYLYPLCIRQHIYPLLFFKKKHAKEYLKVGLPLLPHYLSLSIFNFSDRIVLGLYDVNITSIGIYSQGYGIGANAMILINGIFSAIGKTLQVSFRAKTPDDNVKLRLLFISLILGISIFLFNIALWMKEIYMLFFRKPELQTGYFVAVIVLMAHIFFPFYIFAVFSLFISKQTKVVARITSIAAIVNLILNIILTPFLNIWAAILTTLFSFIFLSVVVLFIKEVQQQLAWLFPKLKQLYITYMLGGLAVTSIAWFCKDIFWGYKIIVSIVSVLLAGLIHYYRRTFFNTHLISINLLKEKIKNIQ
jgi:O-antigen/teichoic acid export membrane protein